MVAGKEEGGGREGGHRQVNAPAHHATGTTGSVAISAMPEKTSAATKESAERPNELDEVI